MTQTIRASAPKSVTRDFLASQAGNTTALSLFGIAICCMIGGLAIDPSNAFSQKERLNLAADAAAQVGIVALSSGESPADVRAKVLTSIEQNAPLSKVGRTTNELNDIQFVRFDPSSRSLTSGSANAVKVTLHRDESVSNPVRATLLRLAGVEHFEVRAVSVAHYGQPGRCDSSDGIYGKGQVTLTSGNWIGPRYCVHSQTAVWLPQQNTFAPSSGVSMPNLAACKGKCVDSANPGIEAAVFQMNLNLPKVSDHIASVTQTMLSSEASPLKTAFFANKTLAADLAPLTTAKIITKSQEKALVKGSVVTPTPSQFNDLMYNTGGKLPGGLVYHVDCRDKGNGPTTSISIGGSANRKNSALPPNATEVVRDVALVTDCAIDVGQYARIDNSLIVTTRLSSSSVLNTDEGAVVGDPLKNCDLNRKVYILTMSGISVNSNFTASNVALVVNGDINVAANSSSTEVEHRGTSMHAEGSIQIPSSHTFNACSEDTSGLLPNLRTFKFVMPKA
ncbi:TadE/TadG family type IV pilus assembly protein [Cereibacter sediminicola]|uniref:TadE/TadG family type IV pilus assembly protein n=1 Tax=Cereibacter sediminicola TaxID=2584941 RepID=UPI0011A332AB|nr:Tad domain-containing protein [Cereibacter sediminicola]